MLPTKVDTGPVEHWDSHVWNSHWYGGRFDGLYDRWPMVVKLSERVEAEWFKQVSPIGEPAEDEIAVSGIGTIAAARVIPKDAPPSYCSVDVCSLGKSAPVHEQNGVDILGRLGAPHNLGPICVRR